MKLLYCSFVFWNNIVSEVIVKSNCCLARTKTFCWALAFRHCWNTYVNWLVLLSQRNVDPWVTRVQLQINIYYWNVLFSAKILYIFDQSFMKSFIPNCSSVFLTVCRCIQIRQRSNSRTTGFKVLSRTIRRMFIFQFSDRCLLDSTS